MKLRSQFAAAAIAGIFSTQLVAAPVTLPQNLSNGFGSTQWNITNTGGTDTGGPYTGGCNSSAGVIVNDATGPTGTGDAFDNAWGIWVNGTGVAQANGDLTGTTLTMSPTTVSGLNVTIQYYAVPGIALLRTLVTLQNPTAATIAATVDVPVNYGSDSNSVIQGTSSGDLAVTTADRWVVSSDSGPSDPVNTTGAWYGTGASVTPAAYTQTVFNCAGTQGLGATFNLSIPAGQSVSLAFFAGLGGITANNNTVASALAAAAALFDVPNALANAGGFNGLTSQQSATLANWGPVQFVPTASAPVPALGQGALGLLALLTAGVGALLLRKRRILG
jgi:hypothetical protein